MILNPSLELTKTIPTVTLIFNDKIIAVNRQRLVKEIPFFKIILSSPFFESVTNQIDLRDKIAKYELRQIFLYPKEKFNSTIRTVLNYLFYPTCYRWRK